MTACEESPLLLAVWSVKEGGVVLAHNDGLDDVVVLDHAHVTSFKLVTRVAVYRARSKHWVCSLSSQKSLVLPSAKLKQQLKGP